MNEVYNNIDSYNLKRKQKMLIIIDDMIDGIKTNKKFNLWLKNYFLDAEN